MIPHLEDTVVGAVKNAGGTVTGERRLIKAAFNEDTPGFWLDILILVETLMKSFEAEASDLYGYSLLLCRDLFRSGVEQTPEPLCRFFAGRNRSGGIFLDRTAKDGLLPYAIIENIKTGDTRTQVHSAGWGRAGNSWFRLNDIKNDIPAAKPVFSLRQETELVLAQDIYRTALFLGPFDGKPEGLYHYCAALSGGLPPLVIRFGGGGLNALVDAWTVQIRSLIGENSLQELETTEELKSLWTFLFRERLRDELSVFAVYSARRFFLLLLKFYHGAARRKGLSPVIVLENIHLAEGTAAGIAIELYTTIKKRQDFIVVGCGGEDIAEDKLHKWKPIFPRLIRFSSGKTTATMSAVKKEAVIPPELLEMLFALSLFSRYFPTALFPRLLEESGKTPDSIFRLLSMLSSLGLIDDARYPHPRTEGCTEYFASIPKEKKERICSLVCGRLLKWVEQRKLNPCFRLLLIIAELGGVQPGGIRIIGKALIDDALILNSIISDLVNGTFSSVEQAQATGLLESITGSERAAALRFIIQAEKALLAGNEIEIYRAFATPSPLCVVSPIIISRIFADISVFHLGQRDYDAAQKTLNKAMAAGSGTNHLCLAKFYRLYSLVYLSRQRIGEAVDYLGFALNHAETSGDHYELCLSAYYAASVQFLFGNISAAIKFSRISRESALTAGCPEWADRAFFFEGRLAFETGRYDDSLKTFELLRGERQGADLNAKERLCAAWAYRSKVYGGAPRCLKPQNAGNDAGLFEMEAAFFAGNFQKAGELATALSQRQIGTNFLHVERPDWSSGFAQCEDMFFSQSEIGERLITAYHSLALCRSPGKGEEAILAMQEILRAGQLSELDPAGSFYFYISYLVLEQNGGGYVDMNTAVNLAFKRLQLRASRIEDMEIRNQFLSQPYWNAALTDAARKFKLI